MKNLQGNVKIEEKWGVQSFLESLKYDIAHVNESCGRLVSEIKQRTTILTQIK